MEKERERFKRRANVACKVNTMNRGGDAFFRSFSSDET